MKAPERNTPEFTVYELLDHLVRRYGRNMVVSQLRQVLREHGEKIASFREMNEESLAPCGTQAAYSRHVKRGETIDRECRDAHNEYMRAYNESRKKK